MGHYFYITPEEYDQASKNGVSAPTLEVRVRGLAWSKERAINTRPLKKPRLCTKWLNIAKQNGIGYCTFKDRVNRFGWSLEKAATYPLMDRKVQARHASEKKRIYPKKYVEMAKSNGISYDTFQQRIKRHGWSLEEAAKTPIDSKKRIRKKGIL